VSQQVPALRRRNRSFGGSMPPGLEFLDPKKQEQDIERRLQAFEGRV
jgi:hypothetical protein